MGQMKFMDKVRSLNPVPEELGMRPHLLGKIWVKIVANLVKIGRNLGKFRQNLIKFEQK